VDSLPARPKFICHEIKIGDEVVEMYRRDVLECIQALYGDPEFAPHMVFKPERHYVDQDKIIQIFGDMHTGDWWWNTQVCIYVLLFLDSESLFCMAESPGMQQTRGYHSPHYHFI
jgi:hypothetical protein